MLAILIICSGIWVLVAVLNLGLMNMLYAPADDSFSLSRFDASALLRVFADWFASHAVRTSYALGAAAGLIVGVFTILCFRRRQFSIAWPILFGTGLLAAVAAYYFTVDPNPAGTPMQVLLSWLAIVVPTVACWALSRLVWRLT
jgi:hypothetical protein